MTLYRLAPDVAEIAADLIKRVDDHKPLAAVHIEYLFRDKVPEHQGRWILGRARRMSGLGAWLLGPTPDDEFTPPRPFFVIEISYPTWLKLKPAGQRALVDHELCHLKVDLDGEEPTLSIRGHDFEEFSQVIRRHGLWSTSSQDGAKAMAEQLAMAIDEITDYIGTITDTPPADPPPADGGGVE